MIVFVMGLIAVDTFLRFDSIDWRSLSATMIKNYVEVF